MHRLCSYGFLAGALDLLLNGELSGQGGPETVQTGNKSLVIGEGVWGVSPPKFFFFENDTIIS